MKTLRTIALILLLACTSTGCSYLEARGRDFMDCFDASVGAGIGANLGIIIGPIGTGIGYWDGYEVGILGQYGFKSWKTLSGGVILIYGEDSFEIGSRQDLYGKIYTFLVGGYNSFWDKRRGRDEDGPRWSDFLWLEIDLHLFLGVRLGFNLGQFADFLLGWFGLDICGDDECRRWFKRSVRE